MSLRRSALSVSLTLLMAACAARPVVARAQDRGPLPPGAPQAPTLPGEPPRSIVVTGTGEARATPDEAILELAVETQAPTAKEAAQQNARRMEAVVAALVNAGVPRKDIETRQYQLFPEFSNEPVRPERGQTQPRIVGYRASNSVQLRTRALDQLGNLMDRALAAGANRVDQVRFALSDPQEAQGRALTQAVQRARASAQTIAAALGVELGGVLEASSSTAPPPEFPMPMMARAAMKEMAYVPTTPIQPGEQTVQGTVTLRYALRGGR